MFIQTKNHRLQQPLIFEELVLIIQLETIINTTTTLSILIIMGAPILLITMVIGLNQEPHVQIMYIKKAFLGCFVACYLKFQRFCIL